MTPATSATRAPPDRLKSTWSNNTARASPSISRQIRGRTSGSRRFRRAKNSTRCALSSDLEPMVSRTRWLAKKVSYALGRARRCSVTVSTASSPCSSTPARASACSIASSVLVRGSPTPRSILLSVANDIPAARASSLCFALMIARPDRICDGVIKSEIPYCRGFRHQGRQN